MRNFAICLFLRCIRKIKLRRMRWAEYTARMVDKRNKYKVLVGEPEGKRQRRTLGIDGAAS
jgi:hypothetical protein